MMAWNNGPGTLALSKTLLGRPTDNLFLVNQLYLAMFQNDHHSDQQVLAIHSH